MVPSTQRTNLRSRRRAVRRLGDERRNTCKEFRAFFAFTAPGCNELQHDTINQPRQDIRSSRDVYWPCSGRSATGHQTSKSLSHLRRQLIRLEYVAALKYGSTLILPRFASVSISSANVNDYLKTKPVTTGQ